MVAVLMIAEIVSNGMLSLPSALAFVGMVPGLILIVFLGVFATYTSWLLVKFKMRHPEVHNMGDAGKILFGNFGRELLAFGTIVFAVFATGGQLLAGQIAITALSDSKICPLLGAGESQLRKGACLNQNVLTFARHLRPLHPSRQLPKDFGLHELGQRYQLLQHPRRGHHRHGRSRCASPAGKNN